MNVQRVKKLLKFSNEWPTILYLSVPTVKDL